MSRDRRAAERRLDWISEPSNVDGLVSDMQALLADFKRQYRATYRAAHEGGGQGGGTRGRQWTSDPTANAATDPRKAEQRSSVRQTARYVNDAAISLRAAAKLLPLATPPGPNGPLPGQVALAYEAAGRRKGRGEE